MAEQKKPGTGPAHDKGYTPPGSGEFSERSWPDKRSEQPTVQNSQKTPTEPPVQPKKGS